MADIQTVIDALQDAKVNDLGHIWITDEARCAMVRILMKSAELLKENRKWIPVKERMPDDEGFYLVSADYGNFIPWIAEMVDFRGVKGFSNSVVSPTIGAWMPLPEPWKKE